MLNNSKKFNPAPLLLLLLCAGFILKIRNNANTPNVTSTGGIWNIVTILIYVCWLISYAYKRCRVTKIIFASLAFTVFAIVSALLNMDSLNTHFIYNLATVPYFLIIMSVFYNLAHTYGKHTVSMPVYAFTFFALVAYVSFVLAGNRRLDEESFVVTDVYYALNMLPLLFISKNKFLRYSAIASVGVALVLSGKRTGFVALALGLFVFYIVSAYNSRTLREKKKNIMSMLIVAFIVVIVFNYVSTRFDLDFFERLKDAFNEGESGRQEIWGYIIADLRTSSISELVFGHGLKSVPILIGKKNALAHCDFLEILYDFGIFAFSFFVMFWILIIKKCVKMIRERSRYAPIFSFMLVIALMLSTFSNYAIDATFITYGMITFGVLLGLERYNKEKECE